MKSTENKEYYEEERRKSEVLINHLKNKGYRVNWSSLQEMVIEFLMDEIGFKSYMYVANRYRIEPLIAKSMLREMIKKTEEGL